MLGLRMFEVPALQPPYSAICYIVCTWPDGSATRASGVIVGENDVLTALHAVFDEDRGGWAQTTVVYPGADTSPVFTDPFGAYADVGSIVGRAANWDLDGDGLLTAQESQGDLALIGLDSRIGDVTGWISLADVPNEFTGVIAGYPARGTGLMVESDTATVPGDADVYDVASGLGAGASGGPLLYSSGGVTYVAGVLSSGTFNDALSTYASLFSPGTWQWLQDAMAANDTLIGLAPGAAESASTSILIGTSGDDSYTGGASRDVFTGFAGNDTFDGSSGLDTAIYSGTLASHAITVLAPNELQVADTVPLRDDTDLLLNVERVQFDDYTVAFDVQGNAGMVYRLYEVALGRAPDVGGFGFFINAMDNGVTLTQVAADLISSNEFQSRFGANISDTQFVTLLYEMALHREPDAGGLAFHVYSLAIGDSRADVVTHFSESQEEQANVIGQIQNGMVFVHG